MPTASVDLPFGENLPHAAFERALLLACCRSRLTDNDLSRINACARQPIRWNMLLRAAHRHRVSPLVFNALKTVPAVPDAVRQSLKRVSQRVAIFNIFLAGQLADVLGKLASAGILAVPFKGPVLAATAYQNPALRPSSDLDLLVQPEQFRPARDLLRFHGFTAAFPTSSAAEAAWLANLPPREDAAYMAYTNEYHLRSPDGLFDVDLHQRITAEDFPFALATDALFARLRPARLNNVSLQRLSAEDTLLVLCANGAKDCWDTLLRVCDVAETLRAEPNLDLRRVCTMASEASALRMVHLALQLAHELLDAPLPPWVARQIAADQPLASLRPRIREALFGDHLAPAPADRLRQLRLHMAMRETLAEKWRYCRGNLHPSVGDFTAMPLPENFSFLYRLLRPMRVAGKYAGT